MRISAIRSYNIANRNSFMGKSIESKPVSVDQSEPSKEFKRQEKNVFKILLPILTVGIILTAWLFKHNLNVLKKKAEQI